MTAAVTRSAREPRHDKFFLIVLILIPIIASWPVLIGWKIVDPIYALSGLGHVSSTVSGIPQLDPNVAFTTQSLGHLAARDWLHGRLPWWNPYGGIGLPLAAEGQNPALLFPFVLLLIFHNGPFLLKLALQEVAIVSTFLLLRQMCFARLAAAAGATTFALNGTFAWFSDAPIMPIAFMPLLLLGIENAWMSVQTASPSAGWRGWPLAAVAVTLSLLAGFPETAYLDSLLALAWSLVRLSECHRAAALRFLGSLMLAAVAGIMMAVPFIVPFVTLLSIGDAGMHSGNGIEHLATPTSALGLLVMPYLFGPLTAFGQGAPFDVLSGVWAFLGGYISLLVLFLAILALIGRWNHTYRMRWMLAIWCSAMIGTSFGLTGVTGLVYSLPLLSEAQIFRYSPPSWEFAFAVLAAFAIDDWCATREIARRKLGAAIAVALVTVTLSILLARRPVTYLASTTHGYERWFLFSSVGALCLLAVVGSILYTPQNRRSGFVMICAIAFNGIVLYSIPIMSGYTHTRLDVEGVSFLKTHLKLDRFYTLGPISPNYAAFFGIASVNSDYLPAPELWTNYVRDFLDGTSDPLTFTGQGQSPGQTIPDHAAQLRKNLTAFQNIGVRYLISPIGDDGLDSSFNNPVVPPAVTAQILLPNSKLRSEVSSAELRAVTLKAISVRVGTFDGKSQGVLALRACVATLCQEGSADLSAAPDNKRLPIYFKLPLSLKRAQPLSLQFTYRGKSKLAIWMYQNPTTGRLSPALGFIYEGQGPNHVTVYRDNHMTIDDLGPAAPYFETIGGNCQLTAERRDGLIATCTGPTTLVRRVLWYPGWQATANGRSVKVRPIAPIFQSIALPQGKSTVRFSYEPSHILAITIAFLLGGLMVVVGALCPALRHD
jgi:hypothetical protein